LAAISEEKTTINTKEKANKRLRSFSVYPDKKLKSDQLFQSKLTTSSQLIEGQMTKALEIFRLEPFLPLAPKFFSIAEYCGILTNLTKEDYRENLRNCFLNEKTSSKNCRMVLGMKRVSDDRPYAFRQASDKHTWPQMRKKSAALKSLTKIVQFILFTRMAHRYQH
jgi:hypothetical protein